MHDAVRPAQASAGCALHQPSISDFLSDTVGLSDDHLDVYNGAWASRLDAVRRSVVSELIRSKRRSWQVTGWREALVGREAT